MFILEGIDLGGKTTFSNRLKKLSNAPLLDNPHKPGTPGFKEKCIQYYNDILDFKFGENVICDRLWPSQVIYGKYKRGEIMPEEQIQGFIEKSKEHLFIFFLPSDEELDARFAKRGDEYVTLAEIKELKQEYLAFLEKYGSQLNYNIISK